MKKIIFVIVFLLVMMNCITTYGTDTEEMIESQEEALGISGFIKQAEKYTKESFEDMNMNELYKNALSGNTNVEGILNGIFQLLGSEVKGTITSLGYILIIVVIHSIIKSISEGMGNHEIGEITYYVQYILIVTLIMTHFSETITLIKDTIHSLVGFINSLLPILLALMISTGNVVTASSIQPLLLFIITFIGNFITTVLLPLLLIGTSIGIVSKISDRIQMDRIAKFFQSSIVWILGIVLTVFVSVLSLEGTLTSSVDRFDCKNN